ncbi:RNA-binding domain-containing protein [Neoconidiobolus thromboides FSU 785]|nr:RNA-binding domain-containing protein [Neoconidiobolus thromboides FSU 785]
MKERAELCHMTLQNRAQNWKPNENPNATSDPFKTLIVARLAYDVTESDLRKELEYYGPLKKIKMVQNKETNEPRGYAFVEFEREKDMKAAYHEADGVRLRGKRILIDVERGRTVKDWKPRSLGGGLGYTRKGKKEENQKNSGRAREPAAPRERERDSYDGHRERERRRSRSPYGSRNRERNYDRYRENRYHDRDSHRPPPRDYDRPREYEHGYYRR